MCSYEPYEDVLMIKLNYDNQAEIIALNIENVVLIADTIGRIKRRSYVCEACPMAFPSFGVPLFQCLLCLGMFGVVISQCLL